MRRQYPLRIQLYQPRRIRKFCSVSDNVHLRELTHFDGNRYFIQVRMQHRDHLELLVDGATRHLSAVPCPEWQTSYVRCVTPVPRFQLCLYLIATRVYSRDTVGTRPLCKMPSVFYFTRIRRRACLSLLAAALFSQEVSRQSHPVFVF